MDILAGFGDLSEKPADLGSSPSESVTLFAESFLWYMAGTAENLAATNCRDDIQH